MPKRQIEGSVAFVTGANRGIGRAIVDALLQRGAKKVYAAARNTDSLAPLVTDHGDRIVPVRLDVTDHEQVRQAAFLATDVDILVNNAGVAGNAGLAITDPAVNEFARQEFEVNVFGLLGVTQAFAKTLESNGGGAVVNISSVAGIANFPFFQTYSASKAAVHSITQGTRISLPETLVAAVYPGPIDTDMAKDIEADKTSPDVVAQEILDGIESGAEEIFPDPMSKEMGRVYLTDPKELERQVAGMAEPA